MKIRSDSQAGITSSLAAKSRVSSSVFPLVIFLAALLVTVIGCSSTDELPTADDAMRDARLAAADLESYSIEFWTGFTEESDGVKAGTSEIHRPGIWVVRDSNGQFGSIVKGANAYTLNSDGDWCSREIEQPIDQDLMAHIPESLNRVTIVERLEDGDLVIEGFAENHDRPLRVVRRDGISSVEGIDEYSDPRADNEYPSIDLYRLVIGSAEKVVIEWRKWSLAFNPEEDILSGSDEELLAVADSRKDGPWDTFRFSDFDQLEKVEVPTEIAGECALIAGVR